MKAGRSTIDGFGSRDDILALWREVNGKSTADIEWYEEFTGLKVALLAVRTQIFKGEPRPDDALLSSLLGRGLMDARGAQP